MDIEFENDMQKLLHTHIEDAKSHFFKYKGYPLRTLIYKGYEFTPYKIDSDNIEKEMKDNQSRTCTVNATAVAITGVFNLLLAEGDTYDKAVARLKQNDGDKLVALAVIMKLMDGKTFSIMHEVKEENGETRLGEAVYVENPQFFQIPIKPWGN